MTGIHQHGLRPRPARQALRGMLVDTSSAAVPLPAGQPGRATPDSLGITDPGDPLCFYAIGDHGGIEVPTPQLAVAKAMAACAKQDAPAFLLSNGDIVYFGGTDWPHQFYEAYAALPLPIVSCPGNHDDPRGGDPPVPDLASSPPLADWLANMCSPSPQVPAADPTFEFGRHTQTQPYCDWVLELEACRIISAWSNVPSGGRLQDSQVKWLVSELAGTSKPTVLNLHHPPLSVDAHHGGSSVISAWLAQIIQAAGRAPALIHTGHVHDAQHFDWSIGSDVVPTVVNGNGGYHNLHAIASDYTPGMQAAPDVVCRYADASSYGFMVVRVAAGKLSGEFVQVKPGVMPDGSDATWTRAAHTF